MAPVWGSSSHCIVACRFAITGSEDSTARVWDLQAPAQAEGQNHAGKVHSMSVTPDGSTAVSVAADGCAMVWDVQSGSCRHTLKGHAAALHWACLASDERTLLTVAGDRMVKIWDCVTGTCRATLPSMCNLSRWYGVAVVLPDVELTVALYLPLPCSTQFGCQAK